MTEPIDDLRDKIVELINETNSDTEFVIVLRQSTGENHKISTSIKSKDHFGMMHMIGRACGAWERVNVRDEHLLIK